METVVVFLDYWNVYQGARRTFFDGQASTHGHVDPFKLGRLIASRGPAGTDRVLAQVRVYRGVPSLEKDPKGNAAAERQIEAHNHVDSASEEAIRGRLRATHPYEDYPLVHHVLRTLHYPANWPHTRENPREKGVDVQLAVDFVTGALARRFDVGIIMSADTDFEPVLETVLMTDYDIDWPYFFPPDVDSDDGDSVDDFFVSADNINQALRSRVEVAAWKPAKGHGSRLRPRGGYPFALPDVIGTISIESGEVVSYEPGEEPPDPTAGRRRQRTWCHWLSQDDYDTVADLREYTSG